ncbi:putative nucleotide-diphospho-sugar transferase [Fragilariopsis cylindrus CCMP1102]|uniref:Translation initiation factor eIF2B subunit gamma n=1 Tax=Fragilariopsis cylindrus CCMP1102 TaxID=635003 RepID=A0A1E7FHU0_9STRA|nr:putative nucleotide-diphospho-sugar transferase [Fragilariopsis cylindrus CCMP1102]|eukprot:OEU17741.1 putative nucleotide-diphospho-sugar transferase [Fragilariopsis cylindrus CCMP1102]
MAPPFFQTHHRACAVVLASSKGSRLFPMTTKDNPKHLLPVAGIPSIVRLLESLSPFSQIVITVAEDDTKTLPTLLGNNSNISSINNNPSSQQQSTGLFTLAANNNNSNNNNASTNTANKIYVVKLSEDCYGSVDVLRIVEETKLIDPETRIVVFPGDLVILKKNTGLLEPLIRPSSTEVACTAMLVDVLEQDEHGLPLKESAKSKKGGLSRDVEDIEYIALSIPQSGPCWDLNNRESVLPRIVFKKSKLTVEEDDMTGSTPKLVIPKTRLRGRNGKEEKLVIRTEWSDVHVYSLAPWVRQLIVARTKNLSSIQEDLLPLLISRQYRGKRATFGNSGLTSLTTMTNNNENDENNGSTKQQNSRLSKTVIDDEPYSVLAVFLPARTTLRVNTVSAYLFACKEAVANGGGSDVRMPNGSKRNGKFQTLTLEGSDLGSKINMKSSTVGKSCTLGDKCRLNNVVIMDDVIIGEQCSLQNTLIGFGAKIGNNCSLNDCQVGPGMEIPSGTKAKGEPFMVGDFMEDTTSIL